MFENTVANTLLGPRDVEQQLYDAKIALDVSNTQLRIARTFATQRNAVLAKLYAVAKNETLPADYDADAMYARLVELVSEDDDEVWYPETEYSVEVTYSVTVTGSVTARSSEEAREKVENYTPSLAIDDEGEMTDLDLSQDVTAVLINE
jgi:hypothetical protein